MLVCCTTVGSNLAVPSVCGSSAVEGERRSTLALEGGLGPGTELHLIIALRSRR